MTDSPQTPEILLQKYWGYDTFRPLQEEIVSSVLEKRDVLALLPTGGGKSLCYQLPALMLPGICIVISPLIALMRDQVSQLQRRKIPAAALFSGMSGREMDRILDNCIYGNIKLLYCSPERLKTTLAAERIKQMPVSLVAVDEAHCISQWGYDFRPAYLEIPQIRVWHPEVPILALTATATPRVQQDIKGALDLREPVTLTGTFARRNLSFLVYEKEDKAGRLMQIMQRVRGTQIIYVRSRVLARELSLALGKAGFTAEAYHAGMKHDERNAVQRRWVNNETQVVVCTTAFGMGIDKPDVRLVVHYDLPPSLEEYYQEAGRAGRDGNTAYCVMLYHQADIRKLKENTRSAYPDIKSIQLTYKALSTYCQIPVGSGMGSTFALDISAFCRHFQLDVFNTYRCLKALEKDGWIGLNEGFDHPARVKILLDKDSLYQYQIDMPAHDLLLKAILRNYEGLFLEPVAIRIAQLATILKRESKAIEAMLEHLKRNGVIHYIPASSDPQVTFLADRASDQTLQLDVDRLERLGKEAHTRMEAVLKFVRATTCREEILLAYFAEESQGPCGVCDICRANNRSDVPTDLLARISEAGIPVKQLIATYPASQQASIQDRLRHLEDTSAITVIDNIVYKRKTHEQ